MVTSNYEKGVESAMILSRFGLNLVVINEAISEALSVDVDEIIKKKAVSAFQIVGRPVFVEHGGLYIDALEGLPGGLSKPIVHILKEKICKLIPSDESRNAMARLCIAYCDGRKIHTFDGRIKGKIALEPKGQRDYYYDSIFIPDGCNQTFAEMTREEKNRISHVREAYSLFGEFLTRHKP
jgi:XTP/dITP diphosphohydrolase